MDKTKNAPFTIGTFADMGVDYVPLNVAGLIMKAWSKAPHHSCRLCKRRLVAMISDGSQPYRRAIHDRARTDWGVCDDCLTAEERATFVR
jgi:hypothetical protein